MNIHIAPNSALVKIGNQVKKRQQIAKGIGMIGYTTAPHLHFMVFTLTKNKVGYESLQVKFDQHLKIIRNIEEYSKELTRPEYKFLKDLEENQYKS